MRLSCCVLYVYTLLVPIQFIPKSAQTFFIYVTAEGNKVTRKSKLNKKDPPRVIKTYIVFALHPDEDISIDSSKKK